MSINQAQDADTWVKNGADWNLSQDGSLAKDKWVQNAGSWYHFDGFGNMQTGCLKDGDTWYSLVDSGAMATGWATANGKWSYFEKSGAMVADKVVPASDGESYILGKDGYMLTLKNSPYKNDDIVRLGDGYEYLITSKFDGHNYTDVIVDKNTWYIKPEFKKFSDKYGDEVSNTMLALVDNKEEGQEIDPKAVIRNFQNLPGRYYFGADGRRVLPLPEMTTRSEIKKVGNDLYLEDPGVRLRLSAHFTINNNKLYYLDNGQGKLKTGYFVLIYDGMATTHHHLLVYADQSGEVFKLKR